MEKRRCFLVLFFGLLFFFSCCVSHNSSQLIRQTRVLGDLYKEKLKSNSTIDKRHFNATHHLHKTVQIHPQYGCKESDRIQSLPGQPKVDFDQYGGYVTVNHSAGTAFYYYFAEAQPHRHPNKSSLPLLLWLNGGPGCSSLAYGAMQELGPFRVHSDGNTLYNNRFAWNHAANVLFLESPAGVGFSYSNTSEDYVKGGDKKTAAYNLAFLLNWFERFPEYKGREFYISGESYAGHYVPQLAHTILYHNKISNKNTINFKGIIIGNAVIDDEADTKGMYDYFATHALISDQTGMKINKYCDFSPHATRQSSLCDEAAAEADANINSIDIYNIYAPLCSVASVTNTPKFSKEVFDPCSDYYVYAYLNRPDVQKALHANVTKVDYDWQPCSNVIHTWTDSPVTIIPLLREFIANGLRVWIFSGDTDGRIPVTSTKYSINKMKLKVQTPWHPWFIEGEVGGYTQVYEGNVTFATIRGAGHQVPSFQPARALSLAMHFLSGTELPNSLRQ